MRDKKMQFRTGKKEDLCDGVIEKLATLGQHHARLRAFMHQLQSTFPVRDVPLVDVIYVF